MLHRLILKVTKFQLPPPKRLGTMGKNILGGHNAPPPMSNRVKVPLGTRGSNSMLLWWVNKIQTSIIRLNKLSHLLGPAQQKALLKIFMKFFSEMHFERTCNVHGLHCRN